MSKQKPQPHPLDTIRLANDWSWDRIAREIGQTTGVWRSQAQWRRIAMRISTPRDRTQAALDQFLRQSESTTR